MTIHLRAFPAVEQVRAFERPARPSAPLAAAARDPDRAGRFHAALRALGREIDRGEGLLHRALHGAAGGMTPGDLIALQAGIYRYSEAVDLTAKLVERATSSVRTTLQGSS